MLPQTNPVQSKLPASAFSTSTSLSPPSCSAWRDGSGLLTFRSTQGDESWALKIIVMFRFFSQARTLCLIIITWSLTVLYLTGTYLLISLGPSNPSVTSCRLSSLPSTPYLGVKPVFVLITMFTMFAIYGNILKKWVHGQI